MTDQEIEKLRKKLGSEYSVKRLNGAITVELVDIWNGVEFAESFGEIHKISRLNDNQVWYTNGEFSYKFNSIPSTEAAYVEQLKAKSKELYGEIKDGDIFDVSGLGHDGIYYTHIPISTSNNQNWFYDKCKDILSVDSFPIYNQGKWAKKIERVRVVPSEINCPKPHLDQYVTVELRVIGGILDASKSNIAAKELAKCLEDYLNKIP